MLAFITKPFLEAKAEINSVFEAWRGLGSVCLFYLLVPLLFLGKAAPGPGGYGKAGEPKYFAFTPAFYSWGISLLFSEWLRSALGPPT